MANFPLLLLLTVVISSTHSILSIQISSDLSPKLEDKLSNFNFTVVEAPPGFELWTSPVVLPSPVQDGSQGWAPYIARAKTFVNQLTIEEKVNLTTGAGDHGTCVGETGTVPRLHFNQPLCLQDGPIGVRQTDLNSVFPAGINIASSFDKKLMYKRAKAMATEFVGKGVNVALAPMTNLMRTPESGRSFEGFGGDPYLSGVATVQTILGFQDTRLSACVKHYIGNEQEHYRGGSGSKASSSNIEDRTLRELYDWPFSEAIQVGVDYVMCSYNRINQTYACENSKLLNGILKDEKKFQGVVVTDWTAAPSGVRTALAGTDMNMPGFIVYQTESQRVLSGNPSIAKNSYWGAKLVESVRNGSIPIERLDDMVTRIMSTYYKRGQDLPDYPPIRLKPYGPGTQVEKKNQTLDPKDQHLDVQADHGRLIRQLGSASTILLKNLNQSLPLCEPSKMRSIAIIGSDAADNPKGPNGCIDRGCDNGTLASGWGSGTAEFPYLVSPSTAIQEYVLDKNPQINVQNVLNDHDFSEIQRISSGADVTIVHVNSNSGEGYLTVEGHLGDRNDLKLWHDGDQVILKTAQVSSNVIVVIHSVGPVDLETWIEHKNVTGVLWAGLPGQESGNSEVDILWGAVNPSARLPYTIAKKRSDYPARALFDSTMTVPQITYSENLEIDYRHFDAHKIKPRFEYGFGLSYTSFEYQDLKIECHLSSSKKSPEEVLRVVDLYETVIEVRFTITNVGKVDGHEVPQLYIGFPDEAGEPPQVLRGFERVFIKENENENVLMTLRKKDISIWDVVSQEWIVPKGEFNFKIGSSSRSIHLSKTLILL